MGFNVDLSPKNIAILIVVIFSTALARFLLRLGNRIVDDW